MIPKSMALIGFAGSGKTAAGMLAARELGLPFTDLTDSLPKIQDGTNIDELHSLATLQLSKASVGGGIVACNDSVVMMPRNRRILEESFVTVLLDAPFEVLFSRLEVSGKPLSYHHSKTELAKLYELRAPQYEECARYTLDASLPIEELASAIAEIAISEGCVDVNNLI